jgi:hypothetical protein
VIDHVSLPVRDLERAARFYDTVLGAIGFARLETRPATVGFGKRYPELWLNLRPASPRRRPTMAPMFACVRAAPRPWTPSSRLGSRPAGRPTAHPGCGLGSARAIMRPSSGIPTAIASRRSRFSSRTDNPVLTSARSRVVRPPAPGSRERLRRASAARALCGRRQSRSPPARAVRTPVRACGRARRAEDPRTV